MHAGERRYPLQPESDSDDDDDEAGVVMWGTAGVAGATAGAGAKRQWTDYQKHGRHSGAAGVAGGNALSVLRLGYDMLPHSTAAAAAAVSS